MSAEVKAEVPDLFERAGAAVFAMGLDGKSDCERITVFAVWGPASDRPQHAYITMGSQSFSLGLCLASAEARELAANLLRAADLADAHQCALDAEKQTLQEGA